MKIGSVMLGSAEPARLGDYYRALLGTPRWDEGGFLGWDAGLAVGPHDGVQGANPHPGRVIWNLVSGDVPGDFARLRDAGGIVVAEPYEAGGAGSGTWIATFADPDGNYFQLMSPME